MEWPLEKQKMKSSFRVIQLDGALDDEHILPMTCSGDANIDLGARPISSQFIVVRARAFMC